LTYFTLTQAHTLRRYLLQLALFVGISMVLGSVAILWVGENPLHVYTALIHQGFLTRRGFMIGIQRATPLILTAAAATMAFRAGAINMGLAGQFTVGSAFAAIGGYAFRQLPKPLSLPLALLFCAAGGAAAGFIPALFKRMSGVNEVITGMIANLLMPYLLNLVIGLSPFLRMARGGASQGIPSSARFIKFAEMTKGRLGGGTEANTGIFLALSVAIFLSWWIQRSKTGFEVRMTKANYTFAEFAGVRASRTFFLGMMLSGAIAALGGATEALGVWGSYRLETIAVGEKGLVISLIGAQSFIGSAIAALAYGGLESGTMNVSWVTSVPRPLIDILINLIIILAAVPSMRTFFVSDPADADHLGGRYVSRW